MEYTLLTATNLSDGGRAGRADHGYPVPHYSCYRHSCFVIHGRLVEPGSRGINGTEVGRPQVAQVVS